MNINSVIKGQDANIKFAFLTGVSKFFSIQRGFMLMWYMFIYRALG